MLRNKRSHPGRTYRRQGIHQLFDSAPFPSFYPSFLLFKLISYIRQACASTGISQHPLQDLFLCNSKVSLHQGLINHHFTLVCFMRATQNKIRLYNSLLTKLYAVHTKRSNLFLLAIFNKHLEGHRQINSKQ